MASRIQITDEGVTRKLGRLGRRSESVTWAELTEVRIHTTAGGPFAEDVFFVLVGSDGGCVVPQGEVPAGFLERLQALPGFDNEALIAAMSSTSENDFLCWSAD